MSEHQPGRYREAGRVRIRYAAGVDLAFLSVEHTTRDVEGGSLLRYTHANGASMLFLVAYLHIFRSLYYSSYSSPRELVWCLGVVILLSMIIRVHAGAGAACGRQVHSQWE